MLTEMGRRTVAAVLAFCTAVTVLSGCSPKKQIAPVPVKASASSEPSAVKTPVQAKLPDTSVQPLKKGGVPGKYSNNFLALQKAYNLAAVPTYDGFNQSTHPKVLYFPNGWNGYKYWMSITPYPYGIDDYENPCIVVSNDAKTWITPAGLKNPVTGIPSDVKIGAHYSDSHIVMRGSVMELWYRYNKGNPKTKHPDESIDYYYRITSTDGIHWSKPQLMQQAVSSIISLAVNYEDGRYQFWFTNSKKQLMYADSADGVHWQDEQPCSIALPTGYLPWHQDLIHYRSEYYLLQTGIRKANYSFALFLSESSDGTHFTKGVSFYPSDNPVVLTKTWLYRSTVWADGSTLRMMVSYRLPGQKWYLTPTALSVQQWQTACATQKGITLKAPAVQSSAPSQKPAGGGAKSTFRIAPKSAPAQLRKNVGKA